jgi:hypothetical protein
MQTECYNTDYRTNRSHQDRILPTPAVRGLKSTVSSHGAGRPTAEGPRTQVIKLQKKVVRLGVEFQEVTKTVVF